MAKYKIAWLPGDGIGVEVLEAAKIVLDRLQLDAEYLPGDIGWEFWRREGDALPPRTVELLQRVDAAMFGAITSKPARTAAAELAPELQDRGLSYRSPIVRMRQLFDLYVCLRPCKGYPGNPLNFKEGIDLVVFRENTEDLYAGVEFAPVPPELARALGQLARPFAPFAKLPRDQYAISCKINTRAGSERIVRAAFDFARKHGRKKVTVVHKANVVRATDGLFLEAAKAVAKDYPEIPMDDANIDAMTMWLLKNPHNYDVLVAPGDTTLFHRHTEDTLYISINDARVQDRTWGSEEARTGDAPAHELVRDWLQGVPGVREKLATLRQVCDEPDVVRMSVGVRTARSLLPV